MVHTPPYLTINQIGHDPIPTLISTGVAIFFSGDLAWQ